MHWVDVDDIKQLVQSQGLGSVMQELILALERAFKAWSTFQKCPRHATHFDHGVIELMPCSDDALYGFKYVNGHPGNPKLGYPSVMGLGMLCDVTTGMPLLLSEMTFLTAIRTACMTALVASYAADQNTHALGLIGVGAQAEFLLSAMQVRFPLKVCYVYDPDPEACQKFLTNVAAMEQPLECVVLDSAKAVCQVASLYVSATAVKSHQCVIEADWVKPGDTVCGIGGDCPGKSELDPALLAAGQVVVEYLPQSEIEGDIQRLEDRSGVIEFWRVALGQVVLRARPEDIVVYDSVGFALEDWATLKWLYGYKEHVGQSLSIMPHIPHPKNLFAGLME